MNLLMKRAVIRNANCTLFDFYTVRELLQLQAGITDGSLVVARSKDRQTRFYAVRDEKKVRLPKDAAHTFYLQQRIRQTDRLNEEARQREEQQLPTAVKKELQLGQDYPELQLQVQLQEGKVHYFQNKGVGWQEVDQVYVQEAIATYNHIQELLNSKTLPDLDLARQLSREYLPYSITLSLEMEFSWCYRAAPVAEFYTFEGARCFKEDSQLERELREGVLIDDEDESAILLPAPSLVPEVA